MTPQSRFRLGKKLDFLRDVLDHFRSYKSCSEEGYWERFWKDVESRQPGVKGTIHEGKSLDVVMFDEWKKWLEENQDRRRRRIGHAFGSEYDTLMRKWGDHAAAREEYEDWTMRPNTRQVMDRYSGISTPAKPSLGSQPQPHRKLGKQPYKGKDESDLCDGRQLVATPILATKMTATRDTERSSNHDPDEPVANGEEMARICNALQDTSTEVATSIANITRRPQNDFNHNEADLEKVMFAEWQLWYEERHGRPKTRPGCAKGSIYWILMKQWHRLVKRQPSYKVWRSRQLASRHGNEAGLDPETTLGEAEESETVVSPSKAAANGTDRATEPANDDERGAHQDRVGEVFEEPVYEDDVSEVGQRPEDQDAPATHFAKARSFLQCAMAASATISQDPGHVSDALNHELHDPEDADSSDLPDCFWDDDPSEHFGNESAVGRRSSRSVSRNHDRKRRRSSSTSNNPSVTMAELEKRQHESTSEVSEPATKRRKVLSEGETCYRDAMSSETYSDAETEVQDDDAVCIEDEAPSPSSPHPDYHPAEASRSGERAVSLPCERNERAVDNMINKVSVTEAEQAIVEAYGPVSSTVSRVVSLHANTEAEQPSLANGEAGNDMPEPEHECSPSVSYSPIASPKSGTPSINADRQREMPMPVASQAVRTPRKKESPDEPERTEVAETSRERTVLAEALSAALSKDGTIASLRLQLKGRRVPSPVGEVSRPEDPTAAGGSRNAVKGGSSGEMADRDFAQLMPEIAQHAAQAAVDGPLAAEVGRRCGQFVQDLAVVARFFMTSGDTQ